MKAKRTLAILLSTAAIAAVATTLISMQIIAGATPTFASGKLIAIRGGEWTEDLHRVSSKLVLSVMQIT